MSLTLALLVLFQELPQPVVDDPFAADAHRNDVAYRSEVRRILPLLEQDETRATGDLEVRDLLQKYPGSPVLRYEHACAFARDRKWDAALREWNEAIFADDGQTVVTLRSLEGIAAAEAGQGRNDAAVKTLERLAAALPLSYRVQNRLAEACAAAGRMDAARKSWERSISLNPAQPDVQKRLGLPATPKRRAVELPALLKRLEPSIVQLQTEESRFTGFAALARGWILTCAHGLKDGKTEVEVFLSDAPKQSHKGRVHFRDAKRDLAVIHCPSLPSDLPVLPLVSVDGMQPGEKLFTVGHPGLRDQVLPLTPSEGILAAAHREMDGMDFIQASMNVNPGNSGGPLVNQFGEVIGVVVRKSYLDGVCFAVPASALADALAHPAALHAPPLAAGDPPKR